MFPEIRFLRLSLKAVFRYFSSHPRNYRSFMRERIQLLDPIFSLRVGLSGTKRILKGFVLMACLNKDLITEVSDYVDRKRSVWRRVVYDEILLEIFKVVQIGFIKNYTIYFDIYYFNMYTRLNSILPKLALRLFLALSVAVLSICILIY